MKIRLEKLLVGGWEFTINNTDIFRTNSNNEGLFSVKNGEIKQILGTTQFSLPTDRTKSYQKIYREFSEELKNE